MPVDEEINLDNPDGISDDDIRKMEAQADDIVALAEKAAKAKDKLDEVTKLTEGKSFAQLEVMNKLLSDGGATPDGKAKAVNIGDVAGMSMEELADLIIDMLKALEEEKKKNKEQEKEIDEMKEKINDLKSSFGDFNDVKGNIMSFTSNPAQFAKNKTLNYLGKAGFWGLVAQFVITQIESFYDMIISEIKSWYEDGGPFDRRKLVEDELKEFHSMDQALKIKHGVIYYSADTSRTLYQGAPRGADNTRLLRDGNLQYMQTHFDE